MTIASIINGVIRTEGGFVDNPSDPGGATRFGITERVARAAGYQGHMRDLPQTLAYTIYHDRYVVEPGFDKIAAMDAAVGEKLIDAGVNCGQYRAALWLQQALNALNRRSKDYPNMIADGKLGPTSRERFRQFRAARKGDATTIMLRALDSYQGAHYLNLCQGNDAQFEDFLNGWLLNRIGNVKP